MPPHRPWAPGRPYALALPCPALPPTERIQAARSTEAHPGESVGLHCTLSPCRREVSRLVRSKTASTDAIALDSYSEPLSSGMAPQNPSSRMSA